MKHLRYISEGLEYENQKLSSEDYDRFFWDDKINDLENFTDSEKNEIRRFFAAKSIPLHKYSSEKYIQVETTRKNWIFVTIHRLRDEWFLLRFNKGNKASEYFKCDQLEGLMEKLDEIFKDFPTTNPDILINKQDDRKKLEDLRKEVFKKIRILSFEDLTKLNQTLK